MNQLGVSLFREIFSSQFMIVLAGHNHNLLGSGVGIVLVMHPVNLECDHTDLTRPVSRQQLAAACQPGGNLDQSQASMLTGSEEESLSGG